MVSVGSVPVYIFLPDCDASRILRTMLSRSHEFLEYHFKTTYSEFDRNLSAYLISADGFIQKYASRASDSRKVNRESGS